jgi:hypothetical protein
MKRIKGTPVQASRGHRALRKGLAHGDDEPAGYESTRDFWKNHEIRKKIVLARLHNATRPVKD